MNLKFLFQFLIEKLFDVLCVDAFAQKALWVICVSSLEQTRKRWTGFVAPIILAFMMLNVYFIKTKPHAYAGAVNSVEGFCYVN